MPEYRGWRYSAGIVKMEDTVTECYLSFYRQMEDRDWYDEVRYDSHERKRGRRIELPHFHIKVRGSRRSPEEANAALKEIVDSIVPQLLEVTER